MALGKIKADTLEHSTAGSVDTRFVVNGSAKHWSMIANGGTPSISNSLNASSVSDDSTGNFTITLSSAMENTNQAALGMIANSAANPSTSTVTGTMETTTTLAVETVNTSGANLDVPFNQFAINGDLA